MKLLEGFIHHNLVRSTVKTVITKWRKIWNNTDTTKAKLSWAFVKEVSTSPATALIRLQS